MQLFVSTDLKYKVLSSKYADTVTIEGVAYRKVDPVYLTWLRRNHSGSPEDSLKLKAALETFHPDMVGIKAKVPKYYDGPEAFRLEGFGVLPDDPAGQERVEELDASAVHELFDARIVAAHTRDREKKPGSQEVGAQV